jgi:hypothetical protein
LGVSPHALSIRRGALLLHRSEHVVDQHIRKMVCQDVVVLPLSSRGCPLLQKIANLSFVGGRDGGLLSAENDVGGVLGRLMFGDAVAKRWQVDPSEHRFALPKHDRGECEMQFVN